MELADLNTLLNKALGTLDEHYTNGKKEIEKCNYNFVKTVKDDKIKLKVYSYFFPSKSALEKNGDIFWFIQYKDGNSYNEYDFSIDLLKLYIPYITNENSEEFNSGLDNLTKKFGIYKNFDYFFSTIQDYLDHLLAIEAFFTKDNKYFNNSFGIITTNDDIQKKEFIFNLKEIISKNVENKILKNEIKQEKKIKETQNNIINILKTKIDILERNNIGTNNKCANLEKELQIFDKKFKNLEEDNIKRDIIIKELKERLDQIDLRDTLKMSFRYLYNILYEHFAFKNYEVNFWAQIKIIKETFRKEFNNKYNYIPNFIDDLEFHQMDKLNKQAHSSDGNRTLENIKTYLQDTTNAKLDDVINFFNKFPFLEDFININLKFYLNQEKAESEFKNKHNILYSEIYKKVFEAN